MEERTENEPQETEIPPLLFENDESVKFSPEELAIEVPKEDILNFPVQIQCEYCKDPAPDSQKFCGRCGFPIGGSILDRGKFINRMRSHIIDLKQEQKQINAGRVGIFIISGLCFILIPIYGLKVQSGISVISIALFVLTAIYGGLGWWSYRQDFEAIYAATVIYISYHMIAFALHPVSVSQGILFKFGLAYVLIRGTIGSYRARKLRNLIILKV